MTVVLPINPGPRSYLWDVAFDGVGGTIGRAAFGLVRAGGRFLPFGMASGEFMLPSDEEANRRHVTVTRMAPAPLAEAIRVTQGVIRWAQLADPDWVTAFFEYVAGRGANPGPAIGHGDDRGGEIPDEAGDPGGHVGH